MDRVLVISRLEQEEERRRQEEMERRAEERRQRKEVAALQAPTESDFDDLYGEVMYAE